MSDYRCPKCEKFKKPDLSKIDVGSVVSFSDAKQQSRQTIRISSKNGEVTAVDGDVLTIKVKRGGTYKKRRQDVTPEGAPSALTYAFLGTCECGDSV